VREPVFDDPRHQPDVEWFAPYPPRGTFWLEPIPERSEDPPDLGAFAQVSDRQVEAEPATAPLDHDHELMAEAEVPAEAGALEAGLIESGAEPVEAEPPATIDLRDAPHHVAEPDVLDLRSSDDDELLRAIFRDLTPSRRTRRRGRRDIPDFEPIHIDDPITTPGR
jgi:hypothetical protein